MAKKYTPKEFLRLFLTFLGKNFGMRLFQRFIKTIDPNKI